MVLFTILVILLAVIGVGTAFALILNGAALIFLLIEPIVCIVLITLVARFFIKKWKSKK